MPIPITPLLQRQPKEEEEELIQAKGEAGDTTEVEPSLEDRINSLRGGGSPLSESARNYFELRFGYDFNAVRFHADAGAASLARSVNAQAFTVGRDIVFGAGQYAPETREGQHLLAHELTHVVQQNGNVFKWVQMRCGEDTPPAENHASIRSEVVSQASAQIGEHYLWGTEGERPGLGDVVMDVAYQGVAKVSGGCVCSGRHSRPEVAALPHMEQSVTSDQVGVYCANHSFLRKEGAGDCGGGCGEAAGHDIWGECCIGHRHFDCSGFVHWSYNQAGYNIGRNPVAGYQGCDRNITQADLQPGDLCYKGNTHVGIYAGGNQVIEAEAHNHGVVQSPLDATWTSFGSLF